MYAETGDQLRADALFWSMMFLVLGFVQWRKELPGMSLEQLRAKKYKMDSANTPAEGKKLARNWVPGDQFLAHVIQKMETTNPIGATDRSS